MAHGTYLFDSFHNCVVITSVQLRLRFTGRLGGIVRTELSVSEPMYGQGLRCNLAGNTCHNAADHQRAERRFVRKLSAYGAKHNIHVNILQNTSGVAVELGRCSLHLQAYLVESENHSLGTVWSSSKTHFLTHTQDV